MSEVIVSDEAEYWETENRDTLIEKRACLQGEIDALAGGPEAAEKKLAVASLDEIVAHIERIAKKL